MLKRLLTGGSVLALLLRWAAAAQALKNLGFSLKHPLQLPLMARRLPQHLVVQQQPWS